MREIFDRVGGWMAVPGPKERRDFSLMGVEDGFMSDEERALVMGRDETEEKGSDSDTSESEPE